MEIAYQRRSQSLVLAGTVVPRIESTLGFRVAGKIIARAVDVGATVKAGDLIAQLDPADYRLAVDNARAALVSAEADYARAKADHERYLALRGSAAFTPQTLEQRQSVAATTLAKVEQAKSQLATAENNLAYTELHADAPGVITAVQAEVGQVMAQGQGVVKVARTDELEILVGVPEHWLKAVREANAASFELWSDPGRRHAARLRELSPSADPMTRTYPARFSVVELPEFIGLGMTATLAFGRPDAAAVAEVPLSAIFQRGTQPAVWVFNKETGAVEIRPVTIARWRDDTAAIASGVKDGEMIATAGVHKLEAGQKVKPLQQQQAAR
jgi:RND family efflux transporter MFP subunit